MNADEYHHQQELHQQWIKKKESARAAQDDLNKIIQEIKNDRQTSKATSSK